MTDSDRKLVCVSGLPRSGSTLMCQLLAQHPEIHSTGHSSPLAGLLNDIRHRVSDNDFFLSQLDVDFDRKDQGLEALLAPAIALSVVTSEL